MKYLVTFFAALTICLSFSAAVSARPAYVGINTDTTEEPETEAATEAVTETTTSSVPTDENGEPLMGKDLICYNTLKRYSKWGAKPVEVTYSEEETSDANAQIASKSFSFAKGDSFTLKKFTFNTASEQRYSGTVFIPGNTIAIRGFQKSKDEWYYTTNYNNEFPKEILFIDTDSYHAVLGLPAVYKNNSFAYNTRTIVPEEEQPIKITQAPGGYTITYTFPQDPQYIGEMWVLQSANELLNWQNPDYLKLIRLDYAQTRRLCYDGYYFECPSTYTPTGENVIYRQPSNYTGASLINYSNVPVAYDLGYITTYLCAQNQNEAGFWATGPQSGWLFKDFGITNNFYDTRFNTDFASNLIAAYRLYYDEFFLKALLSYGDFFNTHAANNHYETENGGWLVEDYGGQEGYRRTHCSLNHQLAEMDVLYKISYITSVKSYRETANNMLKGIEDTRDDWVMENNNLVYALHYTGSEALVDYPYLTYNDLYTTQQILSTYYHTTNETLDYLMKCKKIWMDENNITGYYTNQQVVN